MVTWALKKISTNANSIDAEKLGDFKCTLYMTRVRVYLAVIFDEL